MAKYIFAILLYILFVFLISPARAANTGDVVINEIAWMGTVNYHGDEWIELYNNTETAIDIEGWTLQATDGAPTINIVEEPNSVIAPGGFFLLERTNDTSVPSVPADQIYTGALGNSGEHLELRDAQGNLMDDVNSFGNWFAGDNIEPTERKTMERINPNLEGSDAVSWSTSAPIDGTPKAQNSVYQSGEVPPPPPTDPTPPPTQSPPPESDPTPEPTPQEEPGQNEPISEPTATSTLESATSSTSSSQANPEQPLQQIVYPLHIFINELMPSPLGSDAEEEWIEIINESDDRADISSWQIRDTLGAIINTYTFPEGYSIAAHAFLVLYRPTTKITMNNDDEAIELLKPDGKVVQTIPYSKAPEGQSYARTKTAWAWSNKPTPWIANIISQPQTKTKKAPVYKAKSTNLKNTSINPRENPRDSKKDTSTTTIQGPQENTSPTQTAAIGELAPKIQNTFIYILAPLIALLSAILIFLLKKRLQS